MFLDVIVMDPKVIQMAGFEFTFQDLIIHTFVETAATIIIEGIIFVIFCKEVNFKKVAIINAITCIGLHIVYYFLANNVFAPGYFPRHPNFQLIVKLLLTGHIQLVVVLEIIVCLIEYFFYISESKQEVTIEFEQPAIAGNTLFGSSKNVDVEVDIEKEVDKKKVFLVTILANLVAFFVGIAISAAVVMWLILH